jgi:serine/threonine-protein kinase RsbW
MTDWDRRASGLANAALCRIETGAGLRTDSRASSAVVARRSEHFVALTVPGKLSYRQLVLRVVEASCKLVRGRREHPPPRSALDDAVVSACSEAFNNVAIHGYRNRTGEVRIEVEPDDDGITVAIFDHGESFHPEAIHTPRLEELPENGMGIYIIRSFMDVVQYRAGRPPDTPNELRMQKRLVFDPFRASEQPKENAK